MAIKKFFIIFFFFACFLGLFCLNAQVSSEPIELENQTQAEPEDSETQINNPVDWEKTKETIDKNLPQAIVKFKEWVGPFTENIIQTIEAWMTENMPAAKKEFLEDIQSLPKELWNSAGGIWAWIANFFKK
ncbi:MAG: hypothetical protein WC427_00175 [Candidatus Paceibacterota bacterium]